MKCEGGCKKKKKCWAHCKIKMANCGDDSHANLDEGLWQYLKTRGPISHQVEGEE